MGKLSFGRVCASIAFGYATVLPTGAAFSSVHPTNSTDPSARANITACGAAGKDATDGLDLFNQKRFREAHDVTLRGLAVNPRCEKRPEHILYDAYLTGTKALSEHFLNEGDWLTDLNRAESLLSLCIERLEIDEHTKKQCAHARGILRNYRNAWTMPWWRRFFPWL
jgi:hypothetical protein